MRHALIALSVLLAAPTSAQNSPTTPATPHQRALAAGYVALTTCSALFTARDAGGVRRADDIRTHELSGIYPELDPLIAGFGATVMDDRATVPWDERLPPRLAFYRASLGCTIMPIGTAADWLPRRPPPVPPLIPPPAQWPAGDLQSMPVSPHRAVNFDADAALAAHVPDHLASPFVDAILQSVLVNRAFTAPDGYGGNTTAIVIVRGGAIIAERYADGFGVHIPQRTWSVAKSLAATLVGAAVQRGDVNVGAPAAIPQWQQDGDPRQAITLDHLLHMASGLTSDTAGNRTDALYFGGTAVDEQAPGWPLVAPPGSTFRYANNDTLLATLAIAPTFERHPPRAFFDSVNMHATIAETDWRGNYILSSQVWATARDLARFGMLYLNDGVWNGQRILPENWRTYVSTPSGPQPPGDFGYGAGFWLMNRSEGVPADTFAAFGNRGQYVVIVPSRNIVIVRRGEDPHGTRFDIAAFSRDVLAALD